MKKSDIPLILSSIIIILSCLIGLYIFSDRVSLTDYEKLQSLLTLIIASAGIVSVIVVLYSYIQTNLAFISSQRPSLLVQVQSLHLKNPNNPNDPNELKPHTRIHYANITNNSFFDLTFHIRVYTDYKSVNLSDLFRENMNMPGKDTRQRNFDTIYELDAKGFDIVHEVQQGNLIKLEIAYSYTFLGNVERILSQEYKWNDNRKEWEIF